MAGRHWQQPNPVDCKQLLSTDLNQSPLQAELGSLVHVAMQRDTHAMAEIASAAKILGFVSMLPKARQLLCIPENIAKFLRAITFWSRFAR